jgi:hypothetical protein
LNDTGIYHIYIDKIIKPDYIMKCDGLGMPLLTNNGTICGNLLIHFDLILTYIDIILVVGRPGALAGSLDGA